ncbi:phosphoglucomutase/phosphomannomutase family protein [bacterium]|nr:phosphoglucomutase/phosphomannomutase family protein [bacterium]
MTKDVIKFGTDGFRGIMGKNFTKENVKRIICALTLYLRSLKSSKNTVVVGYDPRKDAKEYAQFVAQLLKDKGFFVVLSSKVVPTPVVAYCAKNYEDSLGAIMLTASHNPCEYQGIKFIPPHGGPAEKEITDKILEFLDMDIEDKKGGSIVEKALEDEYISHIKEIIDFDIIKKNCPKIIYDGLYSSTIGYFDRILDEFDIDYACFNMRHDPDFGGGLPEPKPKFMHHFQNGFITFANDGDGDRYGIIDELGHYVSPNVVLAMLLKYLVSKNQKGKMIKTVGVSKLVDIVAKKLKVDVITTPVGFKWLSYEMRKNPCILAGEDSGGLSCGNHIPEKDGIFANLLVLEMIASSKKPLSTLSLDIKQFAGCDFLTDRVDIELEDDAKVQEIIDKFKDFSEILNYKITSKLEIDGLKLFLEDDKTSLLIRKSGTEPLLRFYIETDLSSKIKLLKEFIEVNIR